MNLGSEIRAELARQNMSAGKLADIVGLSHPSIYRKLKGERVFSVEELIAIGKALGTRGSVLLSRAEEASDVSS